MLRFVMPHQRLASVLEIQVERLRALGIRGLLLDLDCTLKDYEASDLREEVHAWVGGLLTAGFRACLLSNGRPARVGRFAERLGIPFVAKAYKPFPFGCRRGVRKLGLRRHEVAMVGDQLFADVLAGRLAGTYTILVHPTSPVEPWFTRIKRPLERRVLRMFPIEPPSTQTLVIEVPPTMPRSGDALS